MVESYKKYILVSLLHHGQVLVPSSLHQALTHIHLISRSHQSPSIRHPLFKDTSRALALSIKSLLMLTEPTVLMKCTKWRKNTLTPSKRSSVLYIHFKTRTIDNVVFFNRTVTLVLSNNAFKPFTAATSSVILVPTLLCLWIKLHKV